MKYLFHPTPVTKHIYQVCSMIWDKGVEGGRNYASIVHGNLNPDLSLKFGCPFPDATRTRVEHRFSAMLVVHLIDSWGSFRTTLTNITVMES